MTIMTPAEIGVIQAQQLVLVPDPGPPGAGPSVHVALGGNPGSLLLKSLLDQGSGGLSPLVTVGDVTATSQTCSTSSMCPSSASCIDGTCVSISASFAPYAGWVQPGSSLVLYGNRTNSADGSPTGLGQLTVPLANNDDKGDWVQPSPASQFTPWNAPTDCATGYVGSVALTNPDGNGAVRYAASCILAGDAAPAASLWLGGSDPSLMPSAVASGSSSDTLMNPTAYAYIANEHFVVFSPKMPTTASGAFAYASTPSTLAAALTPFSLVSGQSVLPQTLVPNANSDAFALFLISVPQSLAMGSIWSGNVAPANYAALGQTASQVQSIYTASNLTSVATLSGPTTDTKSIYMAGATLGQTQVNLTWTRRDGSPLVLEQGVHSTQDATCMASNSCNTIVAASASPLGVDTLVVWIEQTPAQPPQFSVYGVKLLCSGD